ncbi:MlaD family protein [Avibacterium paragallinarum]|uniref:PqiB family protein n=1 Tax=Avibacterium paragallinarum TaxID=728 RepID=UPI002E9FB1A7|nr:MlaD family protein [Avibacterium paragallinarum]MEE3621635.1 MlaD family protein [Avibacterium paragallinarum]MEE3668756.1 MlaD family protein [Avibacterium paragallinarum]MEE3680276.1 MlaD family protein [Avibacterium paragallinarum]MEE4385375.1 MlaD family protein [Avibacterium paragallinarum]
MTDNKKTPSIKDSYNEIQAAIRKNKRISPFWLLPFIALCIGAILFFQIVQEQGTNIKITFDNGDGLVAGKTQIRYQGLQIGVVKKVNFTDDLKKVEVQANIYPEAKTVLRENTKFWLVRPSASLAGISGIDALVSGNYITLQPGDGDSEDEFVAENEGPIAQVNEGDLLIHLLADDLGSISIGASVYFKKMPVGKIYDYRFTKDQKKIEIDVVIDKPYAQFVKKSSHFWNISGINANIGLSGISVKMDSLNAIVQGAVAFDSPNDSPQAKKDQQYRLYPNLQAAKRGVEVAITVPNSSGLKAGKTAVYSQDSQIGLLSELSAVENNDDFLQGKLLIDPSAINLFTKNSEIVLRNTKFNLGELSGTQKLLRGEYFDVITAVGEPQTEFTVIKENELLLKQPDTLVLTLTSPETYNISEGQQIYYNNFAIGEIVSQRIEQDNVHFKIAIAGKYRHLIHPDTLFIAASNFEVSVGVDGIKMQAVTPEKWLQGGIRIVAGHQAGKLPATFPLYSDLSNAEAGIVSNNLSPTLTLTTSQLPSIDKGSLVLYRQYEVGKILAIRPKKDHFDVDIFIYPKYRDLLTSKSLFWVESAAQVDITPKGIIIQASPITRTLKGAISFDNSGSGNKILYPNEMRAKSAGQVIKLSTEDATNLSKGMPLRYMGLSIGEIDSVELSADRKILATALINPKYMAIIAKENSKFRLISPQISAGGIENLDSLLQPYIDVEAGNGKERTHFRLAQSVPTTNKYGDGFPLILETKDAMNITTGSPVMYRGVEVGTIRSLELNPIGDRVLVHILIANKHKALVRQNSEFWIASGYGMELGFTGLSINTGSMQQLLKGGIAFSTPSGSVVQPQAKANQRFLLQDKRPKEAINWNLGILDNE